MPQQAMPCFATTCQAMPRSAMQCYAMPCYAALHSKAEGERTVQGLSMSFKVFSHTTQPSWTTRRRSFQGLGTYYTIMLLSLSLSLSRSRSLSQLPLQLRLQLPPQYYHAMLCHAMLYNDKATLCHVLIPLYHLIECTVLWYNILQHAIMPYAMLWCYDVLWCVILWCYHVIRC